MQMTAVRASIFRPRCARGETNRSRMNNREGGDQMPLEFPEEDEEVNVEGIAAYLASQVPFHLGRANVEMIVEQFRKVVEVSLQNSEQRKSP